MRAIRVLSPILLLLLLSCGGTTTPTEPGNHHHNPKPTTGTLSGICSIQGVAQWMLNGNFEQPPTCSGYISTFRLWAISADSTIDSIYIASAVEMGIKTRHDDTLPDYWLGFEKAVQPGTYFMYGEIKVSFFDRYMDPLYGWYICDYETRFYSQMNYTDTFMVTVGDTIDFGLIP